MAEKFFWSDQIVENIINSKGDKKEYACASGITPSGSVHIGNFREVITTDLVVKTLENKGKKVRFIYSWDDYDKFRKVPKNIPKSYEKYLGMPISEIPSPFGAGSYAEHFEKEFEKSLKKVGIKPLFIRQSIMYKKCKYAPLIKTAIEKKNQIKKIFNRFRKEPLEEDWFPITAYCEKCGKDFTKILSAEGYFVEYKCKCGFQNKIDYRKKGNVKLLWRVDWPMRWTYEKIDFEPGGIDHSVTGGSYSTAKEIVKKVFDFEAPLYQIYEWVRIKGGKEFSSSSGDALTLNEVEEVYEPEVIRYLFVGTKPKTAFQISFDNDVIKIYDDYDALEKKYYENKTNPREKRIYELSRLKVSKKKPERLGFRHLITVMQTGKDKGLNAESSKRAEKVRNWLEKYAGEDMRFKIQKKILIKLTQREKEALLKLRNVLAPKGVHQEGASTSTRSRDISKEMSTKGKKDLTEKELFNMFYEICQDVGMTNTEFFDVAYRVIINKKKGPRLANLILTAGKENIIKLLRGIK